VVSPSSRRALARKAVQEKSISIRFSCETFGISQSGYRYLAKHSEGNEQIADWLVRLTSSQRSWGFGLCFLYLRNVKGFTWNHKRVYRIYRQLELNLRIKPKKRLVREKPAPLAEPQALNHIWSMDFMQDQLSNGKSIRLLNIMDDYNREGPGMEIDFSLPSQRVIRSLEQIMEWRGKPHTLRCDNGPEYISHAFLGWAEKCGIRIEHIQPGCPQQNAYVERYNRTVREWLNQYAFDSLDEIQDYATQWLWFYNNDRPNTASGGFPPSYKRKTVLTSTSASY
jgi:putative transposase